MSRIGKLPITVPAGVTIDLKGQTVSVKAAKGELSYTAPEGITLSQAEGQFIVERTNNSKRLRALHGTVRALVNNMVEGVTNGYTSELEIQGVGFKGVLNGNVLTLSLGYSHDIDFPVPEGLTIEVGGNGTQIKITGCNKQQVGQAAARIRSFYKAEPYKGKGVRYKGEQVRRKAGKAVA